MSSINSERRGSKASTTSKSDMQRQAARDKRDAERSKKDRDLAMIAVMQAPAIQARAAARDREENMCSQLATRIVGGVSMFMALLLFVVATVITAQACCGDHTKYNDGEFKRECKTDGDKAADNVDGDGDNVSQQSCYKRNINSIIVISFAIYLLVMGVLIIIAGECLYSTESSEARTETRMEDLAGQLKAQEIERRLQEREDRRWDREERRDVRDEQREERRLSQLEGTREERRLSQLEGTRKAEARGSRYDGAMPYRRYSVGSPATVKAPFPTAPVYAQQQYQSGPALVQSQRRGTMGFQQQQQQQPQMVVRQVPAGAQQQYVQSTGPRYVSQSTGNVQVRVVPQQQV